MFTNRVIGMGHAVEWPPRYPDLTPCDFCFWGYLKQVFMPGPPRNLDELEARICDELGALRRTWIVCRAVLDMTKRAQTCLC